MDEPAVAAPGRPEFPHRFEQRVCSDDVGLDKVRRALDGPVDVGLRRQVHQRIGREIGEEASHRDGIADIERLEPVIGPALEACQVGRVARVGELVHGAYVIAPYGDQVPDQSAADKSGTTRNQHSHLVSSIRIPQRAPAAPPRQ